MKTTALASNSFIHPVLPLLGVASLSLLLGAGVTYSPALTIAILLGGLLIGLVFTDYVVFVYLLMLTGGIDVRFITGGAENLFSEFGRFLGFGGMNVSGFRLLTFVIGVSLFLLLNKKIANGAKYAKFYCLFLLFSLTSFLYTNDLNLAIRSLFKLIYPFYIFLLIVSINDAKKINKIPKLIFAGGIVVSIISGIFYFSGTGFYWEYGSQVARFTGGLWGTNQFSFYMLILSLFSYVWFLNKKQSKYLLLFLIFSSQMFLTFTRITMLAFLISLLIIHFMTKRRVIGVLLSLSLCAVILFHTSFARRMTYTGTLKVSSPSELLSSINTQHRENVWTAVFGGFSHNNIIYGKGLGSSTKTTRDLFFSQVGVIHNDHLRLFYDGGMIGSTLFLLAYIVFIIKMFKIFKHTESRDLKHLSILGICSVISFLIIAITDNPLDYYPEFHAYVWTSIALVFALNKFKKKEVREFSSYDPVDK